MMARLGYADFIVVNVKNEIRYCGRNVGHFLSQDLDNTIEIKLCTIVFYLNCVRTIPCRLATSVQDRLQIHLMVLSVSLEIKDWDFDHYLNHTLTTHFVLVD